jgi:hypothetical protein
MLPYWILFFVFAIGAIQATRLSASRGYATDYGGVDSGGRKAKPPVEALLLPAALLTVLMIGLRYQVGGDWATYVGIFTRIQHSSFINALTVQEPGFSLVNWLVAQAGLEIWAVNLVCAAVFIYGLYEFGKSQPNPWLVFVVAVPYLVIGVGMGYTRQAAAIGLSMVGLVAVSRGSLPRFVFWVLLAALFHRSAVILIPIVTLSYSRNRLEAVLVGGVAIILGYFVSVGGVDKFERGYINQVYQAQGAGIRLSMNLVPALIYLFFSKRFTPNRTERTTWRTMSILAVVAFAVWLRIESTVWIDRLALYLIPLQLYVLGRFPTAMAKRGQASPLLVLSVIAYSALVELVWLVFANHSKYWIPYRVYPLFS